MELRLRNASEGLYIQKTREVINGMRSSGQGAKKQLKLLTEELRSAVSDYGSGRNNDGD